MEQVKDNTQELIEKLTKALEFKFHSDSTKPGMTIAWLPHSQSFYISLIRWSGNTKNVIFHTDAKDLLSAVKAASNFLVEDRKRNPLDDLKDILHGKSIFESVIDWSSLKLSEEEKQDWIKAFKTIGGDLKVMINEAVKGSDKNNHI